MIDQLSAVQGRPNQATRIRNSKRPIISRFRLRDDPAVPEQLVLEWFNPADNDVHLSNLPEHISFDAEMANWPSRMSEVENLTIKIGFEWSLGVSSTQRDKEYDISRQISLSWAVATVVWLLMKGHSLDTLNIHVEDYKYKLPGFHFKYEMVLRPLLCLRDIKNVWITTRGSTMSPAFTQKLRNTLPSSTFVFNTFEYWRLIREELRIFDRSVLDFEPATNPIAKFSNGLGNIVEGIQLIRFPGRIHAPFDDKTEIRVTKLLTMLDQIFQECSYGMLKGLDKEEAAEVTERRRKWYADNPGCRQTGSGQRRGPER